MDDIPGLGATNLIEAQEASDVSAINGIVSLANILRKRGLLSDAEASAIFIESFYIVGKRLPASPVPLILGRVSEQVSMKLADVIFIKWDCVESREDRLHHFGIACDFLLITCGE